MMTMMKRPNVHVPAVAGRVIKTLRGTMISPRSWTIGTMAALLIAGPVAAQRPGMVEVGGFGQWTWFDDNAGRPNAVPQNGLGYGGRLGVFLTRNWQVEADGYYSPQDRKLTEEFCCLGMFPDEVIASAFALRLNYNVPVGGRSQAILGAGATRTHYRFEGGNAAIESVANFGASGLLGLRMGLMERVALRVDGVADYMPNHEPEANLNLHARAGLSLLLGGRAPVVAMAPLPPPPPPPVAPPPAPPAAPREDAITVCVIDPTATGGIRMQTATFRHAQGDTIVMVGGQAQPLRQVVGTGVMTARDAGWYVRGEPLSLTIGRETVRYLPYQTATRIEPNRIVYLGNVNGYPVYADRDEVADVIGTLQTARGTRTDVELGTLLAGTDARTRDIVQRAAFLYVPMDPYGCVFQPVQRVEDVRKGK
jgi:hypothetical protein